MIFPMLALAVDNSPVLTEWDSSGVIFLKLLAILLLVLLNGFFVASEFSIVKVRSSQLEPLVEKGDARAISSKKIVSHLDAYLSATQLGITLTSLGLGWLGEPFLAAMLEPFFALCGIHQPWIVHPTAFVLAFGFITYLHIVLGELAPKSLAIRKSLAVTLAVSRPLHLFYQALRPFIWFFNGNANWFLKNILKVEPVGEHELAHSEEELRVILSESEEANEVTPLGKEILINALDLKHRVACDIMTPRGEVVYLDLEEDFDQQVAHAIESRHTRFPLCRGHIDESIGLVHIKDLLALVHRGEKDLLSIKRELLHVSEMMPLEKLLRFFLSKQAHLAVAVDEYGGAVGIVTLDNVLEELVGSINDEFDAAEEEVRRINDRELEVEGAMALYELAEILETELDDSEVSTLGGYITSAMGHIPAPGEQLTIGNYLATVTQSDGRRVLRVHLKQLPQPAEATTKD